MTAGFRKFLAITQLAGGLAVLGLPMLLSRQGYTLAWWYWALLESFGGTAVVAGVWLWRKDPRGWRLSSILQAIQLVQFQTTTYGVNILAGFQLRLQVSETGFEVGPGFRSSFGIVAGKDLPWWISINFFAAYALFALYRSEPGTDEGPASAPDEPEPVAERPPPQVVRPPWAPGMPPRFRSAAEQGAKRDDEAEFVPPA